MTGANADLILAGVSAGGTSGLELMWVAPTGSTGPTDATAALDAAFQSCGYITSDGATLAAKRTTKDVDVYGSIVPVRKLLSKSEKSIDIAFRETSPTVLEIYNMVELGSIIPDANGKFTIAPSAITTTRYAFVLVAVDGENIIRNYYPNAEVTDVKDRKIANGDAIEYGCTITPYPDATGRAVYEHYLVPALAGS